MDHFPHHNEASAPVGSKSPAAIANGSAERSFESASEQAANFCPVVALVIRELVSDNATASQVERENFWRSKCRVHDQKNAVPSEFGNRIA